MEPQRGLHHCSQRTGGMIVNPLYICTVLPQSLVVANLPETLKRNIYGNRNDVNVNTLRGQGLYEIQKNKVLLVFLNSLKM